MSFWAGIKHALNSTLGTEDFQPLDKLFISGKSTVASDNPLYTILNKGIYNYNASQSTNSRIPIEKTLIAKSDGSFKVIFELDYPSTRGSAGIEVFINGNLVTSVTDDDTSGFEKQETGPISYKKDDVITFGVYRSYHYDLNANSTFIIQNVELCADVVDVSMFKISS
jgi:hypothetical protein